MSTNSLNDQLKYIVSVVRALIISRKPPVEVNLVLRDFCDVEGDPLPYKKFGYETPEDFLQGTGEFTLTTIDGVEYVSANFNKNTEHIASMVRNQKKSKPIRFAAPKPVKKPYNVRPGNFMSSYNTSQEKELRELRMNYEKFIEQQKKYEHDHNEMLKKHKDLETYLQSTIKQHQIEFEKKTQEVLAQSKELETIKKELEIKSKIIEEQKLCEESEQKYKENKPTKPAAQALEDTSDGQLTAQEHKDIAKAQAKIVNLNIHSDHSYHTKRYLDKKTNTVKATYEAPEVKPEVKPEVFINQQPYKQNSGVMSGNRYGLVNNQYNRQPLQQYASMKNFKSEQKSLRPILGQTNVVFKQTSEIERIPQQESLQPHVKYLQKSKPAWAVDSSETFKPPAYKNNYVAGTPNALASVQNRLDSILTPPKTPISLIEDQFNENTIAALDQLCQERSFSKPIYTYHYSKGMCICNVSVNGKVFSSYPYETNDNLMAKSQAAHNAIEKLSEINSVQNIQNCTLTDNEFIDKLYNELLKMEAGVVTNGLGKWWEAITNQNLPNNWWQLVTNCKKFKCETQIIGHAIIYANDNPTDDVKNKIMPMSEPITTQLLPALKLPWQQTDNNWSILVTYCRSTVEIWGRLFGPDYMESLEKLITDMSNYMEKEKVQAEKFLLQQIYLVKISNCWHRVQIEEINFKNSTARCFFIDFGDADVVPLNDLYNCPEIFLQLAPQTICFSLYGLHDFADHPYAHRIVDEQLSTKTFVAKLCTKESEFIEAGGHIQGQTSVINDAKKHGLLQVVLYDTSPATEDININELLLQQICERTPLPQLRTQQKSNPVIVSHVGELGSLYVLLPNDDIKYIKRLIGLIVASKFQRDQHRVTYTDLNRDNMFLICDDISTLNDQPLWYRGMMTEKPHSEKDEVFDIYYIDDGRKKSTHISKIFRLESLSLALAKFPPQAIHVKLYDVPQMSPNIETRLHTLLPSHCSALARVNEVEAGTNVPLVTLYTRADGGAYCAVNDTLRIEHELALSNDKDKKAVITAVYDDGTLGLLSGAAVTDGVSELSTNSSSLLADALSNTETAIPATTTAIDIVTTKMATTVTKKIADKNTINLLPALKEFKAIPAVGAYFEVRIPYSANPMYFVVQPYKEYTQLNKMMLQLKEHCDHCSDFITEPSKIKIGQAYIAKSPDGFFNRVEVLASYDDVVRIQYVDFGDEGVVRSSELRPLPLEFRHLPKMALPAKLYGIKNMREWSKEASVRFRNLTLGKQFVSIVHKMSPESDAENVLNLELIDTSTPVDILIHELLIKEELAVPDFI